MDQYFFVFGRYPALSLSEIETILKKNKIDFSRDISSDQLAVFSLPDGFNGNSVFEKLGGSVKFGKILSESSYSDDSLKFQNFLSSEFLKENFIPQNIGKIHFGISFYEAGAAKEIMDSIVANHKNFCKTVKENLKNAGLSSGFLQFKERILTSVAVLKNNLLDKGFELNIIAASKKILVGKTLNVQDFESFAKRDMLRPKKDKKSGILPVKLARIMVNLLPENPEILYDPFCGSGTILMEAALLGVKNLIGSDISPRAVSDTKVNLDWLIQNFNFKKESINLKLTIADVLKLKAENVSDAIVTEPYLGPPLFRIPSEIQAQKIIKELSPLYKESLKVFYNLLKNNGNVVMVFPFIQSLGKKHFIDKNIIQNSKFKILYSFSYSSPGQFVGREIVIFSKISYT